MLKKRDYKLFDDSYFTIVRKEINFVELKSNATGHFWSVFSNQFDEVNRITVYHKKRAQETKYHEYSKCDSVVEAISHIKEFDKQFLERQEKKNTTCKESSNLKVYEGSGYKYKSTPTIILKGEWLRKYGFDIGEDIKVRCDCLGELIIHKVI